MRRYCVLVILVVGIRLSAQVPYFGACPEKGLFTGYTSLSYYTADNAWDSYTFFQYAFTDYLAGGMHIDASKYGATWGPEIRGGYNVSDYFMFSLHVMSSFDLTDKFKFSYVSNGLYMEGTILKDRKLFWLTNTYCNVFRGGSTDINQLWYLGSDIPLGGEHTLTPMVAFTHSWKFNEDPNLDIGLMYVYKNWSFFAWCGEIISGKPYISLGIEFDINTKP